MKITLNDAELITMTRELVAKERSVMTLILWHLREIENRRLHATEGFPSLFEYCLSLGYSEGQAHRRITSMRLLRELPEIADRIEDGSLTLSNLALAQKFLKQENYSRVEKLELVSTLENRSRRETEKELAKRNPDFVTQERERIIAEDKTEIRFV